MRDIVPQRVVRPLAPTPEILPVAPVVSAPETILTPKTKRTFSGHHAFKAIGPKVGKVIETTTSWASHLLGSKKSLRVVSEARTVTLLPNSESTAMVVGHQPAQRNSMALAPLAAKGLVHTKSAYHHTKGKVSGHAKKAAGAMATPLGRASIIHLAVTLGLFGYLAYQNQQARQAQPTAAAKASLSETRRYLPVAGAYQEPAPFQEQLAVASNSKLTLHAWVTPWNIGEASQNTSSYKSVSAFWLTLNENGTSVDTKSDWGAWSSFATSLPKETASYLTITANPNISYRTISDPNLRTENIAQLLKVVTEQNASGVDIDFEGLGRENRQLFTAYIEELTTAFHARSKKVAVTVEARVTPDQPPMDWQALGKAADELRIMAYDYHASSTGTPGPISPIGWVKELVEYAQTIVPSEKLIIGLGNYGYDWALNSEGEYEGRGISYDQAVAISKEYNAPIVRDTGIDDGGYDKGSIPAIVYTDSDGRMHYVFFEDSASLGAKLTLVSQYRTAGAMLWSVGLGDAAFWQNRQDQVR